jgi:hypothetical protein
MRTVAAGFLTVGFLFGGTAVASAVEPVVGTDPSIVEVAPTLITEADVAAAHAAFKQAQIDAKASEKKAAATAKATEKAEQAKAKLAKGKAKKAAQAEVKVLKKSNQTALKALKAANRVLVNDAKAVYQELAAAYEAQQEALMEEPVVEQPATA